MLLLLLFHLNPCRRHRRHCERLQDECVQDPGQLKEQARPVRRPLVRTCMHGALTVHGLAVFGLAVSALCVGRAGAGPLPPVPLSPAVPYPVQGG